MGGEVNDTRFSREALSFSSSLSLSVSFSLPLSLSIPLFSSIRSMEESPESVRLAGGAIIERRGGDAETKVGMKTGNAGSTLA
jgi:hypothetical protein